MPPFSPLSSAPQQKWRKGRDSSDVHDLHYMLPLENSKISSFPLCYNLSEDTFTQVLCHPKPRSRRSTDSLDLRDITSFELENPAMMIKSLLAATILFNLLQASVVQARTFHNTEGKSIEAELLSVEGDLTVMKLTNGRVVKVAINKFAPADQDHIKAWWQKNKNLLTARDVKLSIRQKSVYTKKPQSKQSGNSKIKTSESEITFLCNLDNYSTKTINGIKASYSVYKRISKRGKEGSSSEVEIIEDTMQLGLLESHKDLDFTIEGITCSDTSVSPSSQNNKKNNNNNQKVERSSHRETVIGMVLTLSIDGREILTQSHPKNFIRLLKEQEIREDRKDEAASKRDEQKDIEADKRGNNQDTGRGRRDREDAEREKRKREAKAEVEKRKAEEEEARKRK